jgi:hypothetical protein
MSALLQRPDAGVPSSSPHHGRADLLALFLRLLPAPFLDQIQRQEPPSHHNRVYTTGVVMWLMIGQRLQEIGTLETAVLELVRGLPSNFWPKPCKRLQSDPTARPSLSSHTGAYNKARQQLPVSIVEQSFDHVFQQLTEQARGVLPAVGRRAFFLDGTSVRLPYTEALAKLYPPGSNQHGASHWPLIRMLVAHDLYTGIAMRPQWGPLNGPQAVSEQSLLEQALDRLPSGSLLVGDANFGVFSVAYAATQRAHPVLLRLTAARAQRLAGEPLRDGVDRHIEWEPSRDDRRNHPGLSADARVGGRLLVTRVQPGNGAAPFLLALFTTLAVPADEVVNLYGNRWNIETDLRSLKDTLRLEQLTCTTAEMVAKEIDLAMMAYNLVRAVSCLAAQRAGLTPRAFSFTRVRNVLNAFAPLLAAATDQQQARKLWDDMMHYVDQAKLPKRHRKRPSHPRAVWGRPRGYPTRKA